MSSEMQPEHFEALIHDALEKVGTEGIDAAEVWLTERTRPHEQLALARFREVRRDGGESIGEYEILEELGRGSFAVVFRARRRHGPGQFAIKRIHPWHVGTLNFERVRREVAASKRVSHRGICRVFEVGQDGEMPFVVMELVEGETLEQKVKAFDPFRDSKPVPQDIPGLLELIENAARALHAAHDAGIVHRDVKPSNILVRADDGTPVILDFGLAYLGGDAGDAKPRLTSIGGFAGSLAYMAPEQVRAERVDRRADIYSLGVTLFECLTGRLPFAVLPPPELPDPIRINPVLPRGVRAVLETALAREPAQRYATAALFAEDLARVRRGQPPVARRASLLRRLRRWVRRNPAATVVIVVLATDVAVLMVLLLRLAAAYRAVRPG